MDATTIARVKALLDITSSSHDTVLTAMVSAVSRRIEHFLDRKLIQEARTQYYNVRPRQNRLFLREYPVTAIASVTVALDWDYASGTALDSSDYHVTDDTGILHFNYDLITNYLGSNYAYAPDAVRVVYTGGFATSTSNLISSHPDIAMAADIQTVALWRRRDTPQGNSISVGGGSISYERPLAFVPDVTEALAPYRRLRFAANG